MSKVLTLILLILVLIFMHINSRAEVPQVCAQSLGRHMASIGADREMAPQLALEIITAAERYGLSPKLYAAIIAVESMYKSEAYNQQSMDYGLAQINHFTALRYGFDHKRLRTDAAYNLDAGAKVLADFKRRFGKREPLWYCRYNVGTGVLVGERLDTCKKYAKAVQKYLQK